MTGRRGFGIELDPKYADVVLRRVSEETGVEPTLGGVPLSEVAQMRAEAADEVSHEDAARRQDGRPFAEGNVRDDGSYLVGKARPPESTRMG